MLLNKRFFQIILFLGTSTPCVLRAENAQGKLKEILIKHQTQIPFHSSFTQVKSVKEMGIELASEGELEVKAKGYATWKILKPAFLSVEISPEAIKIYNDPQGNPRIIKKNAANGSEFEGGSWMKLLMENPEDLMKNFAVSDLGNNRFKLVPLGKKEGFDSLVLGFKVDSHIEEVLIQENTEDTLKINFVTQSKDVKSVRRKKAK